MNSNFTAVPSGETLNDENTKTKIWKRKYHVLPTIGMTTFVIICIISIVLAIDSASSIRIHSTSTTSSNNDSNNNATNTTNITSTLPVNKFVYPNVLYGHIHMAKTAGTSLNGILANNYERVCGHKGYSYDAFSSNERAKKNKPKWTYGRDKVGHGDMVQIGFEDCDYISHEWKSGFWIDTFSEGKFHNMSMEIHVPCRDRIDHLMSACNHRHHKLNCDAESDEEFYQSFQKCLIWVQGGWNRYRHNLKNHFDVKCYDFNKQFSTYIDYMSDKLQPRRFVSTPYFKRDTNLPRNKTNECIWERPDLLEKTNKWLLQNIEYYQFCDTCLGSDNEITEKVVAIS